ncbi:glutathione S-transferase [Burkholderia sp. Ac-20344]|uniref:glutathione S-transferase n=1 Tax=Burkholderia sp. Ac-20344 TaxID=2703890 RepID=UPI00197B8757|nr:glutathione S-transferase [Burkholderia sp. Ac-20344]MBN3832072.1 glutathione S-transferase [Burkholderia sp. Ac-20344]
MQDDRQLILYHAPRSRSAGARMLLEELGADYELHAFDLSGGKHHEPDYLRTNPMGKVPALRHGEVIVTEQAAVYMYASELYPEAGLSPAVGDALRGPYLRWMVFYGSCLEPAVVDRSMNRPPAPYATSPYGDFDAVVNAIGRRSMTKRIRPPRLPGSTKAQRTAELDARSARPVKTPYATPPAPPPGSRNSKPRSDPARH